MKLKPLPIAAFFLTLSMVSCEKEKTRLDETSISTVYWGDFILPDSTAKGDLVLEGEVGNSRDIDSVHIDVNNLTTGKVMKSVTLAKEDLVLNNRKDWPTSPVKWYDVNYKPIITINSGDKLNFTLVAYSPFGTSQDLRAKETKSVVIK